MKYSLGLVTAMPIKDSLKLAKASEDEGFHRIWYGEDIFHREIFTSMSILSLYTEKIRIATGVTSPYTRYPDIIRNSVQAVSELSEGRFGLGLGVGGLPEVERLTGKRPENPLKVMKETVEYLKSKFDLRIYLGVRGPKLLGLAGQIADGVILSGPKGYIKNAIKIIDKSSTGRRLEKILWNAFYLGENRELISKITKVIRESMPEFALEDIDNERIDQELCISGSEKDILEQINDYKSIGIDEFVLGPPYGDEPIEAIRLLGGLNGRSR
jgi:5,10-methylenetetrahydromethanopterin reductase